MCLFSRSISNLSQECIEGVQDALRKSLWEKAAEYIKRYSEIDPALINQNSKNTLDKAQRELEQVLQTKLSQALNNMDYPELIR